jgi:magnesium chelatase subunit D
VKALLPVDAPVRRMPVSISDDRLLGGLDLGLTLSAGRPVAMRGLMAETHGGVIVAPMAERLQPGTIAHLCATLDSGDVRAQRDGLQIEAEARFGLVALDEGDGDEAVAEALKDRLALWLDERAPDLYADLEDYDAAALARARRLFATVACAEDDAQNVVETAAAFGIHSTRACLFALRVARACAALEGRTETLQDDLVTAVKLTLAPRARSLPPAEPEAEGEPPPPQEALDEGESPEPQRSDENSATDENAQGTDAGSDQLAEAVRAALPPDLLKALVAGDAPRRGQAGGKSGLVRRALRRGRPIGARPGELSSGARLALLATLRAAAPKQALRRRTLADPAKAPAILVRKEDVQIKRLAERTKVATIFVVDASGSSALHRLAEAKGAVQLLLAECYVRRDEAALISFRGKTAEVLLPPTRSLARVRRELAQLPGGGGTPLASGLALANELAQSIARKGDTPILVFFTDGQANVTLEGVGDRPRAEADVLAAAKALRASGIASLLIDTSPRPQPRARKLAEDLGARYLPLPAADAQKMSRAVKAEIAGR